MLRKLCAVLLSALMIFPALPGTALAEPTFYTVSFDSQGGSAVDSIPAEEGTTISAPAEPTKEGHTFDGWFRESTCENAWTFGADTVTGDITLFAKWTINSYTVTFQDWDGTPLKEETVNYGGAATAPTEPSRTGYAFSGWDVAFDNIASALIVTAQYTGNEYTVTFDPQDGTVSPANKTVTFGSAYGELPVPERVGFTFEGWYTQAGGEGALVTADTVVSTADAHTLYAKWTATVYTVSTPQELADALAAVKTKETIRLVADITYTSGIVINNKDITFDVGTHTLTVAPASGTAMEVGNGGALRLVVSDGALNVIASGNGVYGVYAHDGGIAEVSNATATGTTNNNAVYARNGGSVTVNGNAESSGSGVFAYQAGSHVTVKGNATGFVGASVRGGGDITIDGASIGTNYYVCLNDNYISKVNFSYPTTKAGYVTYNTANSTIWIKALSVTVNFMVDGVEYADRTVLESECIGSAQWPGNPVKDGYAFLGWFTGENGAGTAFTVDTPAPGSISVYAMWRSNTPGSHPVGTPEELTTALAAALDGDTIRLTDSITYNAAIVLNARRELTIDVGSYTLTVSPASGNAIEVGSGGRLYLDYDAGGALNAIASGYSTIGVYVQGGGYAEVSNATALNTGSYGVSAVGAGSQIKVKGNSSGYYGARAFEGGIVTIDGILTGTSYYVVVDYSAEGKNNYKQPTTKTAYITYTSGTSTIWVKAQPCIVNFVTDGATYTTRVVLEFDTVTNENWPVDPTKDNHVFAGWFTGENGTGTRFTTSTCVTGSISVYAKWGDIHLVGTPAELQAALAAAKSGDMIKLTANIAYGSPIDVDYKVLTFDVGAYTLTVGPTSNYYTIGAYAGSLLLKDEGGGALNVVEDGSNSQAIDVSNASTVEVTNITLSGVDGFGVFSSGSTVSVRGNITVTGNFSLGVYASGSHVAVKGNITAYDGVEVGNYGDITIDGRLTASNNYITFGTVHKSRADFTLPTTKEGYLTYNSRTTTVWVKEKPCTVTFQSAGATYVAQTTMEGETVGSARWPADPVRDGYTFGGWYTRAYIAGTQFTDSSVVTGDITVYARWIGGEYTVTLDPQGGSVNPDSVIVTFGNPYGTLPTPVRNGLVFTGWYTQQGSAGMKITSTSFVGVEENHILYAKWRDHSLTAGTVQEFMQAISEAVTGDTIHITNDIICENTTINITGRDITIDVGAYDLTIQGGTNSEHPVLEVGSGGRLRLAAAGGTLNVSSSYTNALAEVNAAVYAHSGGIAEISSAYRYNCSSILGYGVYATGAGSHVTVSGDAVYIKAEDGGVIEVSGYGMYAVATGSGSAISVEGNSSNVKAENGGNIEILGDVVAGAPGVTASGAGSQVMVLGSVMATESGDVGVSASGGTVGVLGYVQADGPNGIGIKTQGAGSEVAVLVGIKADGTGGLAVSADGGTVYAGLVVQAYDVVWARNRAEVTLGGINYYTHSFVRLGDPPQLITTPTVPTTLEGFDTYTDGVSTVWDRILYVVTFNDEGDTESIYPLYAVPGEPYGELPAPTRSGYKFDGWYTQPNGGGIRVTAESALAVEANHTLYAKWTQQIVSNNLAKVALSCGYMNRAFSPAVTSYKITIGENSGSFTLTAFKQYDGASMTMNKVSASSYTVAPANGKSATITVRVTLNKKVKTYTFTVTRAKSTNNKLAALTSTAGVWNQSFDPNVTNYTLTLNENTKSTKIYGTVATKLARASFKSKTVSLNNGQSKVVKLTVRAQSGAVRTYVITVRRAPSSNSCLAYLKISGCPLTPAFSNATASYTVTLPANKSSITISAKVAGYKAAVYIDGAKKTSKKVTLQPGQSQTVTVTVIAQSGAARTFTILVKR